MLDLNDRALNLYTREELLERISVNEAILAKPWVNGEYRWEVSIETHEFRNILARMDERDAERSDLHLHSAGY